METLERILAEHAFFKGLDPDYLKVITGCAKNVRYKAGEFILKEGGKANEFYLLRGGRVALEVYSPSQGPIVIETLDAGDLLGWSWLVEPYVWHFDARVTDAVRAIAIDGKCIRQKCEKNRDMGYELLKRFSGIISKRLQSTRLQLLDLYGSKV
jgi:CRP/FNR family cyclic AMP-dependent transcriptional regulator